MKKFVIFILILFLILIIIPSLLSISFSNKIPKKGGLTVQVLHTDSGEIKSENLEKYLEGVVASEMPASFHEEALRAQAVAARTYIFYNMKNNENEDHPGADVCTDSSHCKAWKSNETLISEMGKEWFSEYFPKIQKAVESTSGDLVIYENEPILAVFHSTGSGKTENANDVWGGFVPYLKSVESPGDLLSPKYASTVSVPLSEFCQKLNINSHEIRELKRSEGGAVISVNIGGSLFKGTEIRTIFELNSANFEIETLEDQIIFKVKGNGHGVGMSQYGANALAEEGKTYKEILQTYYIDTQIKNIDAL